MGGLIGQTKQEIHKVIRNIMDMEKSVSNSAKVRALKLFDINSWIKRYEDVIGFLINT